MRLSAFAVIAFVLASGCRQPEPTEGPPPAPDAARVRADLPGQAFDFYADADGPRTWTIAEGEIRRVQVVDTTAREGGVRVRARVVLAAPTRTIRGLLDLDYRRAGDDWQLAGVGRAGGNFAGGNFAGGNFAVGDAGFVLYDVGGVPSDSVRPDLLALDAIARFQDGEFVAPFDAVRGRVRALLDSTLADSLRRSSLDRVATDLRREWVPTGRRVRVWAPGRAARTVVLDSSDVSVEGCEFVVGWARGRADAGALGSTSSALGGTRVAALSGRETRALDRLARQRLTVRGHIGARLRSTGALSADLDGDGTPEVVGTYAVGSDTLGADRSTVGIAVAARMASDGARLLWERLADGADGFGSVSLVGLADLDADGAAEAVLREEGYEVYRYRIVTWRAGRFVDAFRGGGGGC